MATDEKPTESTPPSKAATAEPTPDRRRAAKIATLVAVPVTLVALFGAVSFMGTMATAQDEGDETADEPVSVSAPDMSDADFTVCRALITKLPDPLGELPRRVVSGDNGAPEIAGAWGDPAVKLSCGVEPVSVPADGEVFRLGPTCWFAEKSKKATTWTTVDRELPVRLTVPAKHTESGQLAQAVSKPVAGAVDAIEETPSGCSG